MKGISLIVFLLRGDRGKSEGEFVGVVRGKETITNNPLFKR